jgi:hypothetical protein
MWQWTPVSAGNMPFRSSAVNGFVVGLSMQCEYRDRERSPAGGHALG